MTGRLARCSCTFAVIISSAIFLDYATSRRREYNQVPNQARSRDCHPLLWTSYKRAVWWIYSSRPKDSAGESKISIAQESSVRLRSCRIGDRAAADYQIQDCSRSTSILLENPSPTGLLVAVFAYAFAYQHLHEILRRTFIYHPHILFAGILTAFVVVVTHEGSDLRSDSLTYIPGILNLSLFFSFVLGEIWQCYNTRRRRHPRSFLEEKGLRRRTRSI